MRIFLLLLLVLIVVLAGGLFYLGSQGGNLLQAGIEKYTPPVVGTDVQVRAADLNILGGSASISGFQVHNPPGFSDNPAFAVTDFSVSLDPQSLLTDTVVIRSVNVEQPQIRFEVTDKGANLDVLRKNAAAAMQRFSGDESGSGKSVLIENLTIRDADVTAASPLLQEEVSFTIPEIVLTDLGGEGTADAAAITAQITDAIYREVARRVTSDQIRNQLKKIGADPDAAVEGLEGRVKDLDGDLKDKAKKKLEGILGR